MTTVTTRHSPERLKRKRQRVPNVGEDTELWELLCSTGGVQIGTTILENTVSAEDELASPTMD